MDSWLQRERARNGNKENCKRNLVLCISFKFSKRARLQLILLPIFLLLLLLIILLFLLLLLLSPLLGLLIGLLLGLLISSLLCCLLANNGLAGGLIEEGLGLSERVSDNDVVKDGAGLDLPEVEADDAALEGVDLSVVLVIGVVNLGVDPDALVAGVLNLLGPPLSLVGGVVHLGGDPVAVHIIIPVLGLGGLGVIEELGLVVPVLYNNNNNNNKARQKVLKNVLHSLSCFFFFSLKESSERFVILLKYQSGTNINHQSHLNLFFLFSFFLSFPL